VRRQKNFVAVGNEPRNKGVMDCGNDEDNSQDKATSREGRNNMETRRSVRVEEDAETMERRTRERKGKSVAKEERMEEVYEIHDNTKEEEEMYELDREAENQRQVTGDMSKKQQLEEQQEQFESMERL